jgi:voltage-gated potassium channel
VRLPTSGRKAIPSLRRSSGRPIWLALVWRIGLAVILMGVAILVHWADRDGLRDNVDGSISFADVVYFTTITVTTVGYGDIVPVTPRARMFDTFLVTPIRLFVWLLFLGTAYEFLFKRVWEGWRMRVIQKTLRGHVVVAGYGTSGAEAVRELVHRGVKPAEIVVIDPSAAALADAEKCGVTVLEGDATHNVTLEAARAAQARAIIVAAGRDDTSILIVLTANGLAPGVPISAIIRSQDNEALAKQAGAKTVINPASFAGLLLAGSTEDSVVSSYLADLAASGGNVVLRARLITEDEAGRPLAEIHTGLGVRIIRGSASIGLGNRSWTTGGRGQDYRNCPARSSRRLNVKYQRS